MRKPLSFLSEIHLFVTIFGKPDSKSTTTFAMNAVKTVFSTPDTAEKNASDWELFQKTWCDDLGRAFGQGKSRVETVALNWDVTKIPAAQSGNGHKLVSKGINATRHQIGAQIGRLTSEISVVFDPTPEFPVLYDPQPCKK